MHLVVRLGQLGLACRAHRGRLVHRRAVKPAVLSRGQRLSVDNASSTSSRTSSYFAFALQHESRVSVHDKYRMRPRIEKNRVRRFWTDPPFVPADPGVILASPSTASHRAIQHIARRRTPRCPSSLCFLPEVARRPYELLKIPWRCRPNPVRTQLARRAQVHHGTFDVYPRGVLREDRPDNHGKRSLRRPPVLRPPLRDSHW